MPPWLRRPSATSVWPFAALSASYFAHIGFFNPYLPLWLQDQGFSLLAISLLTSVQAGTRTFAPYAWGWLSDTTGERVKLLRFGGTVALALSLVLWWPLTWPSLFIVLLLMFTHTSAMMPMSEAALAHLVTIDGKFDPKRYGRVRVWGSIGFLVTVVFAGTWFERQGMSAFPIWTSATLLAVVASVWWLSDIKEDMPLGQARASLREAFRQPGVRLLFGAIFFHVLAHVGGYVFFSLYLDSLGYSKTVIGMMWAAAVVAEVCWFTMQSRWLPMFSLTGWLLVAAGVATVRFGVTATLAQLWWAVALAQVLHAITFAAHHTACIALLSHFFPGRLRGRGQAMYSTIGYGVTGVLGGLGGGVLTTHFGLNSVFWVSTACAATAFYLVRRLRKVTPSAGG
ncbi:MAG: MFS transporter [Burkholderiaceae bacterium]|nr:MFS transporter [Burkholderiaceae bacterium]